MTEATVRVTLKQTVLDETRYISYDAGTHSSLSGAWDYAENLALTVHGTVESVMGYPDGDAAAVRIVVSVPF